MTVFVRPEDEKMKEAKREGDEVNKAYVQLEENKVYEVSLGSKEHEKLWTGKSTKKFSF